ncbi:MAG TPA: metallophosphoesterase [Chthonomonadaceae bacterium]|nr:metallophosphoesterase [Chthonomonadaceae bacterium]
MITAVVTSDNHLGAYYARLRPDRLELRRRRLQAAFQQVVDAAIARRADLFLHAGDLFDRPDPRNAERVFVARQIQRLREAEIPVFAVAGNHDSPRSLGYDGGTLPQEEMEALGAICLFRNTDRLLPETRTIRGRRVCIWGMSSDFNRPAGVCPLQDTIAEHQREGDLDFVLLHYGVEGWAQPFAAEPCLALANLDALGADAICVGHLHTRAETRLPGGGLLLNPGATEHIHFGEEGLTCGFWVLQGGDGEPMRAEFVPLTPQPMRTLEIDLSEEPPADEAVAEDALAPPSDPWMPRLRERIAQVSHPDQLLRVRFQGRLLRSRLQSLDFAALLEEAQAANFYCQFDTEKLALYDAAEGWQIDIGFSFDVRQELQSVAASLLPFYGDNVEEQEICRRAAQELNAAYERLTRGAR